MFFLNLIELRHASLNVLLILNTTVFFFFFIVISANLNEEIMSKFLETLDKKFDHESELDLISEYLTAMTKVKRFSLIVKMLDNKVKESKLFFISLFYFIYIYIYKHFIQIYVFWLFYTRSLFSFALSLISHKCS